MVIVGQQNWKSERRLGRGMGKSEGKWNLLTFLYLSPLLTDDDLQRTRL